MSSTTVSDHISSQTTVSTTQSDAGLIRSLEICLVLVVLLLVITITLFALYVRRTRILHRDRKLPRPFVNTNPLNSPFSSLDGHSPQFSHTPGSNMRIATRGSDGSWQIEDPRTPFAPSGISDIMPSPSSSTFPYRSHPIFGKENEAKARSGRNEFDIIPGPEYHPPPAYRYSVGNPKADRTS